MPITSPGQLGSPGWNLLGTGYTGGSGSFGGLLSNYTLPWGLWVGTAPTAQAAPAAPVVTPQATPVAPTFDPKIEANQLYGKPMALYTGGYARMGASPAPLVGPYINGSTVDFVVSFGVPSNPEGDRKIYKIYLDNELAWSSTSGGTLPAHGTFAAEPFDFIFKPGRLDQTVCSLETEKYPGDECAYRPQMIIEIRNLPWARFMANTGKPVPYVAAEIGDVTDGADPLDFINLGEALERIAHCPWANYSSSSPGGFETVGITDIVDAILIKDNFTVIQLMQNVTGEYRNLDLVLSDMVRVKDRGANVTPNFVFDRDSIIADAQSISVVRGSATGQRREHELIAIDPDQDYTAVPSLAKIPRDPMIISAAVGKQTVTSPLVIDASTRQALATFSQNYQENARRRVAFKVRAFAYEIEPGDLFALTDIADGMDNEVFKCTQTTHGGNWIVEVEGEAILRCAIYGGEAFDPYLNYVVLLLGFEDGPDGSTTIVDESPAVQGTATINGDAQIDTAQKPFGASSLLVDGSGDYIEYGANGDWDLSNANSDQFTIECFVRWISLGINNIIVANYEFIGTWAWGLQTGNSDAHELLFASSSGGSSFNVNVTTSGASLVTNTWTHVAVDKDATGKIRVYKDGVMYGSATPVDSSIFNASGVGVGLGVGANSQGGGVMAGNLKELRITKGIARYASDAGFAIPTSAYPRV